MTTVRLAEVPLPEFVLPSEQPVVPAATYAARLAALRGKARAAGQRCRCRLRRSRAQRQHRVPDRFRAPLRGGDAGDRGARRSWVPFEDAGYDRVGNILMSRVMGAEIGLIDEGFHIGIRESWNRALDDVKAKGGKPYAIATGSPITLIP